MLGADTGAKSRLIVDNEGALAPVENNLYGGQLLKCYDQVRLARAQGRGTLRALQA